ncbi:MAG TPA: BTAD domain-containing putative transcriptional regulator [Chthonomonadaceae bacterium]|nr:BTAD domain-containing putative transcriptional regulator [Chthonomonadaceae bacterium]
MNPPRPIGERQALEIKLFGPPLVHLSGMPMRPLRSRRGMWLLALLALNHGRDIDRSWAAGRLWPDSSEQQALASLRTSLADLRRALSAASSCISSPGSRSVRLDLEGVSCDVARFDQAVRSGCLEEAVGLYDGQLMEGCSDEWAAEARGVRSRDYLGALRTLIAQALLRDDHTRAVELLKLAIAEDPLCESHQAQLLDSLSSLGDYATAVDVYRTFRKRLHAELNVDAGPDVVEAYRRCRELAAAKGSVRGATRHVPRTGAAPYRARMAPLIGREADLRQIGERLRDHRVVTLVGPGGIGKTSLVLAAIESLEAAFPGGIAFVDLDHASDKASVLRAICDGLNAYRGSSGTVDYAPAESTIDDQLDAICRLAANRTMLLVLDTCEHVVDAVAALVADICDRAPGPRFLATSRQPLNLARETIWRVSPLGLPPESSCEYANPSAASQSPAVELFVARGRAVSPGFALSPHTVAAVARICRGLDGLPLAIELAAARLNVLGPSQIAARIERSLSLLTGSSRDAIPRHRTLRATLDWSCELLSEAERALFRRLSIFVGQFDIEDVEAVCGLGSIADDDILTVLAGLVDKSMVCADDSNGRAVYRLLGVIRECAAEQLAAACEEQALRRALLDRCWTIVQPIGDEVRWRAEIRRRYPDVRAALSWAVAPERDAQTHALGAKLAVLLSAYWTATGMAMESHPFLERAIELSAEDPGTRKALLSAAIHQAVRRRDMAAAQRFAELALSLAAPDDRGVGPQGLSMIARAATVAGDYGVASQLLTSELAAARASSSPASLAAALTGLGTLALRTGDIDSARGYHAESLDVNRKRQSAGGAAWSMDNLGDVALAAGEPWCAMQYYTEALASFHDLGMPPGVAACLNGISGAAARLLIDSDDLGCLEQAVSLHHAAMAAYATLGIQPETSEARLVAEAVRPIRGRLGEAPYSRAAEAGREMPADVATETAMRLARQCEAQIRLASVRPASSAATSSSAWARPAMSGMPVRITLP